MYTVNQEYFYETEVKNSKFLTFLLPLQDLDKRLKALKEQHPKARHHVVTYRRMNQYQQVEEYATDDNEPKGCAGKPTLNVMRGAELMNCASITVRYFGGIKLGTGGMVRAYGLAVKNVIEHADLIAFEVKESMKISCSYSDLSQVEYFLQQLNIEIVDKQFESTRVVLLLQVNDEEKQKIREYAAEMLIIDEIV